jgi:hypothetical protein
MTHAVSKTWQALKVSYMYGGDGLQQTSDMATRLALLVVVGTTAIQPPNLAILALSCDQRQITNKVL